MSDIKKYFAATEEEALKKYHDFKETDPFPDIPAALLSAGQIQAYIAKTGLVYPYVPNDDPKKELVTSASLTMTIGPEIIFWDNKEKRQYKENLKKGDEIILYPNSITFLRPAERVNIPDYIAARFNLRIIHVHRGLLLGTGPLLDPGFKGYPMIPVHNLTENEYRIQVGDQFISIEFTKIDTGDKGLTDTEGNSIYPFKYIKNRGRTLDFIFPQYIGKHVPQNKVKSSLSAVIDQAREMVRKQRRVVYWSFGGLLIAIVGTVVGVAAIIYNGYQLTISATSIASDARDTLNQYKVQNISTIVDLQNDMKDLKNEIKELNEKANNQQNIIAGLAKLNAVQKQSKKQNQP